MESNGGFWENSYIVNENVIFEDWTMKSAERVKYFYETVISENQIERMAEFISPECCVKMGEKLISVGI